MSLLCLVRHGQASVHAADYDCLSEHGEAQSRALGAHWAASSRRFDRVYVGPLRRHQQTHDAVAKIFQERDLAWPDPVPLAELDEHQGPEVIAHHRADLYRQAGLEDPGQDDVDQRETLRRYLRIYQLGTRQWIRAELETPSGLESWSTFRDRIRIGLEAIVARAIKGERVVAFTSGGATAAAVGLVLGLDDEKILELSWRVRNAALTEVLFSGDRLSLDSFNTTPHLTDDQLTFV
ncbi:MAG: histidine phosphatase family protein [Acidobacteriota bacterium]